MTYSRVILLDRTPEAPVDKSHQTLYTEQYYVHTNRPVPEIDLVAKKVKVGKKLLKDLLDTLTRSVQESSCNQWEQWRLRQTRETTSEEVLAYTPE